MATSSFTKAPSGEGDLPWVLSAHPECRVPGGGQGARTVPPSNALFSYARARLGLSWGRAGAVANGLALVPSDSLGPKLPPGSSRKEAG